MKKLVKTNELIRNKWGRIFYPFIQPIADRFLGFHKLNQVYETVRKKGAVDTLSFCDLVLEEFNCSVEIDPELIKQLETPGPIIVLGNHPYGCIDSMAVMRTLQKQRPEGWKIVSNKLLRNVNEVHPNIITVDPFAQGEAKRANLRAIKDMHKVLKAGLALTMFPASRVSGFDHDINQVCDLPWTAHPLKLATQHKATIILLHISGQNSDKFLSIPSKKLLTRSIRLAKEVPMQTDHKITLSYSSTMTHEQAARISKFPNKEEILKAHTYIGADKTPAKPTLQIEQTSAESSPPASLDFNNHLSNHQEIIVDHPDYLSFCFKGSEEPLVMQEIGKLREQTFSQIGAGSGNAVDLSKEDEYYHHIVVTERSSGKIAGAYRVGFIKEIIQEHGIEGLYLNHIFDIQPKFYEQVDSAMELSRSFIPPEFQKSSQVLDILWKSLGKVAKTNQCKVMYGSVTVSAEFTPLSQSIIIDTLDRYHSANKESRDLISNTNPFKATTKYHSLLADAYAPHGLNRLNSVIEELEDQHRSIPPLARYYATLGAKFLSFKVEPTFNDAIYCLLSVDLEKVPTRYKKRFLG